MKNIQIFTDVSELLLYLGCDLTDDQRDFFSHALDFESIDLLLIDEETVIIHDTCNGDVLATSAKEEYIEDNIQYYKDMNGEEN